MRLIFRTLYDSIRDAKDWAVDAILRSARKQFRLDESLESTPTLGPIPLFDPTRRVRQGLLPPSWHAVQPFLGGHPIDRSPPREKEVD
jgi:hypothetical protein